MGDTKFIKNIASSIAITFQVELSKVNIEVEVVGHGRRLSEAGEQDGIRNVSEAEQSLQVEYKLFNQSATEATRLQEILDDPLTSIKLYDSLKDLLIEMALASGLPVLIKEILPSPAIVTTMVEVAEAFYSFITSDSTTTRALEQEQKEKEGNGNTIVVVGAVAAIVGCLAFGSLAHFCLIKRRRGRDLPEKNLENMEAGLGLKARIQKCILHF